jgi:hypothetical protein
METSRVGQMPTLQVIPIAKKLRIAHAIFNAVTTKLNLFAHNFGIKKNSIESMAKLICNKPGRPNKLLSTVLVNPPKYLSGDSM